MTLLGINCGYGNTDNARLPLSDVDLDGGWVTFPRPKSTILRRCPLWPETVVALRTAIDKRQKSKRPEFDGLVFLTRCGVPWVWSDGLFVAPAIGRRPGAGPVYVPQTQDSGHAAVSTVAGDHRGAAHCHRQATQGQAGRIRGASVPDALRGSIRPHGFRGVGD